MIINNSFAILIPLYFIGFSLIVLLSYLFFKLKEDRKDRLESSLWHEKMAILSSDVGNLYKTMQENYEKMLIQFSNNNLSYQKSHSELQEAILANFYEQYRKINRHQLDNFQLLLVNVSENMSLVRGEVTSSLKEHAKELSLQMERLTDSNEKRLVDISNQVETRLNEGFNKTTATFNDIAKRLILIDQTQQKICELSSNIISLEEILNDKKSRGTFGEVQLATLVENILPKQHFSLQYLLDNGKRVDCIIFLPKPGSNIAIDAKFPLDNFRKMIDSSLTNQIRKEARGQFIKDVIKHIQDIGQKYILPPQTADSAVMFIPAETVFAEIHGNFPEIITYSHRMKVWLVSPTTMMAVLTTARAVLKDEATKKQISIMQIHLRRLREDFARFSKRLQQLTNHIRQAHKDIDDANISAQKITTNFNRIEEVELDKID